MMQLLEDLQRLMADLGQSDVGQMASGIMDQHEQRSAGFARYRAAARMRNAAQPMGGRREGPATAIPEQIAKDVATLPKRAFGAVHQYETEGTYNPAPIMEAAMAMVGTPGVPSGAVGSSVGKSSASLAMDETSRMVRARRLGFSTDEPLYHGSGKAFDAVDPTRAGTASGSANQKGIFLSPSGDVASHYANIASVRDARVGETPHEVLDYMGKPQRWVYEGAQVYPALVNPGRQKVVDVPYYNTQLVDDVITSARREGYDTVRIRGMADTGGGPEASRADQIVVLNPKNIRSRFATFDPERADSKNLLASIGGPAAIGSTLRHPDE